MHTLTLERHVLNINGEVNEVLERDASRCLCPSTGRVWNADAAADTPGDLDEVCVFVWFCFDSVSNYVL